MENEFDFYTISARSTRKTDFLKAGVERSAIQSNRRWVAYGRKQFPRTDYVAYLGFVSVARPPGANMTASEEASMIAAEWRAKGLNVSVSYRVVN